MPYSTKQTNFPTWESTEGGYDPPGATWIEGERAWNFVLYSVHAESVELLFYSEDNIRKPVATFEFDPLRNKSGPIWHCRLQVEKLNGARYYAYRVNGPPTGRDNFHWFDHEKILLDPYAKSVYFPPEFDRMAASRPGPNDGRAPLGILEIDDAYDWQGDRPIRHESDLIIYEMHVRGFTMSETSGVQQDARGTYRGIIEKIPYLQELGVTAVELMPVFQFDPDENNYWGYMPLNFFAPHGFYSMHAEAGDQRFAFREMVRELHKAGIEVILDVVFNHTCEGDQSGPIYSFKGIDNNLYYTASGHDEYPFANYTGCGNTLNAASPSVRHLVVESLRYWREEMHVDGFRFDLASVFCRKSDGSLDEQRPPIFDQIASSPGFADVRLIAEPWDAGGAYQLGRDFPGFLWMQWNAAYRDILQRFWRGDPGIISELMTRIYGSADYFPDDTYHASRPWQSINYVTSHDGATIYDLVSYTEKNNWANGEENRDGCHEYRTNCGYEGDEDVPEGVMVMRKRLAKNYFCMTLLSNGTPMFRMGDEFLQTQGGNNNPYNQDNETSWLDWSRLEQYFDVFRFVKEMVTFRKDHPTLCRSHYWREDIKWYGVGPDVDWSESSRTLAFHLSGRSLGDVDLYVMINGYDKQLTFGIQAGSVGDWHVVVDTFRPSPNDITLDNDKPYRGVSFVVGPQSIVVLKKRR
ncbi:glycogen debranching protein [Calycomorphotria hydatis]|uniref:Glycogen debranching enzyme n=1 Tax=Calycomorphotria hydatis TaxID=2528027 RepID=A0A517T4Z4_9PLAN|nr:isoamylase [Calycomorphotria hydatis]QDT63421.1 Glycogen debranching enzyme [Calycomorphotria hydatis]